MRGKDSDLESKQPTRVECKQSEVDPCRIREVGAKSREAPPKKASRSQTQSPCSCS